jgi:hypothetical protein
VRISGNSGISGALVSWLNEKHPDSKNNVSPFLKSGGREGIRTPDLLIANEEKSEIRHGAAIT